MGYRIQAALTGRCTTRRQKATFGLTLSFPGYRIISMTQKASSCTRKSPSYWLILIAINNSFWYSYSSQTNVDSLTRVNPNCLCAMMPLSCTHQGPHARIKSAFGKSGVRMRIGFMVPRLISVPLLLLLLLPEDPGITFCYDY